MWVRAMCLHLELLGGRREHLVLENEELLGPLGMVLSQELFELYFRFFKSPSKK